MKTITWLAVGNANNWGKGKTLLGAFVNLMDNDSRTYPTTAIHLREVIIDHPEIDESVANRRKVEADDFAAVYVDGMGTGYWPVGAEVRKLDIGKGLPLEPTAAAVFKKWRSFAEEWDELMCTEAMDLAFGGDANYEGHGI